MHLCRKPANTTQIIPLAADWSHPRNQVLPAAPFSVFRQEPSPLKLEEVELHKVRVPVVDHNSLLREGLCFLIQLQADMELVAAAAEKDDAVQFFRQHRPEVVLMDLDLPCCCWSYRKS